MSELGPETRALLGRGRRGETLSSERRASLKRNVLGKAAAGVIVTTSISAAAWSSAAKLVALASVVVVVGTSAGVAVRARCSTVATTTTTTATPATPAVSAAIAPAALAPSPASTPPEPLAASAPPIIHDVTERPRPPTVTAAPAPALAPAPTLDRTPVDPPPPPRTSTLAEESRLLRAAHTALASGDGDGALRLLDEHAARFPASVLEPERSTERVLALCRAGREAEARGAARQFLVAHPSGPLAVRVRSSCGGP